MKKKVLSTMLITLLWSFTALAVTKTTTIQVQGMHCEKCSASVTKALKAVDGVQKVDVSASKGVAVVEYDDQKVTETRLREVINSTGFKAVEAKTGSD